MVTPGDIMVVTRPDRQPCEHSVSVSRALQQTIAAGAVMKPEFVRNPAYLILLTIRVVHSHDFLQCNNIGPCFFQNLDDPLGTDTAIEPARFVNVVSRDPETKHLPLKPVGHVKLGHSPGMISHQVSRLREPRTTTT